MIFWETAGYLLLGGLSTVVFKVAWHYWRNKCWHQWGPWQEGEGQFTSRIFSQDWVEQIQVSHCLKCGLKRLKRLET